MLSNYALVSFALFDYGWSNYALSNCGLFENALFNDLCLVLPHLVLADFTMLYDRATFANLSVSQNRFRNPGFRSARLLHMA